MILLAALLIQAAPAVAREIAGPESIGLGLDKEGRRVVSVAGAAEKAGFRAGDELSGLEGGACADWTAATEILRARPWAFELTFSVNRGGSPAAVKVVLGRGETSGGKGGKAGRAERTLKIGERERTWNVQVPDWVTNGSPAAVLLVFHGAGSTGAKALSNWLVGSGDEAIVAAPLAVGGRWRFDAEDEALVDGILGELKKEHNVDLRRIFVAGFSMGATFAHKVAVEGGDRYAAAAVCAAGGSMAGKGSERKMPVFLHCGLEDDARFLRALRDLKAGLEKAGHPLEVFEEAEVGHVMTGDLVDRAWGFLRKQAR